MVLNEDSILHLEYKGFIFGILMRTLEIRKLYIYDIFQDLLANLI